MSTSRSSNGNRGRGRMIDPIVTVEKILELVGLIKNAARDVEYNRKACGDFERRMKNVSSTVSNLKEDETVLHDPTACDSLKHLEQTLQCSHGLLQECQDMEKQNVWQRLVNAPELSRQLRKAQEEISQNVNVLNLALISSRHHNRPAVKRPGPVPAAFWHGLHHNRPAVPAPAVFWPRLRHQQVSILLFITNTCAIDWL